MPAAFHAGINDVLLTGLAVAMAEWCRRRGQTQRHAVVIDLEGHGREEIFPDVDLSRTVGWFTSLYPVRLDPGRSISTRRWRAGRRWGVRSSGSRSSCSAVPDHGLGYGLLRYLNAQTSRRDCARCRGRNWASTIWGALRRAAAPTGALRPRRGAGLGRRSGDAACPCARGQCAHRDGRDGATLSATWSWAPALIGEADVRALAQGWFQALEALVRHAAQPGAGGRTPSDLPLASLTQAEIERLERTVQRTLRTSCRYRRCRKVFCFMRCMRRRDRTSTRRNCS